MRKRNAIAAIMMIAVLMALMPFRCKDVGSVDISATVPVYWTTPFDNVGASVYEFRYSEILNDTANWMIAVQINPDSVPTPKLAGSPDSAKFNLLLKVETRYYIAMVSYDAKGNRSAISNVATFIVEDTTAPMRIADLSVGILTY